MAKIKLDNGDMGEIDLVLTQEQDGSIALHTKPSDTMFCCYVLVINTDGKIELAPDVHSSLGFKRDDRGCVKCHRKGEAS